VSRDAAFILFVLLAEMVPNLIPALGNDRIRVFAVLGACSVRARTPRHTPSGPAV
jgi:hypothetical protein